MPLDLDSRTTRKGSNQVAFAVTLIFYELSRARSLHDAAARLRAYDDELSMWRLWDRAS